MTATVSLVGGGLPIDSTSWLADPGVEIPEAATGVHGVTTDEAREQGRPAPEVVREIVEVLADATAQGTPIVAFNARYDLTMLDREARRHDVIPLSERGHDVLVIDPLIIDKQLDRYRKGKRTLTAVCQVYDVALSEDDAHAADADAIAAARVAWRMGERLEELHVGLEELHASQIIWAAEQAESLEDYFRRQGRPEPVERDWPIVPPITQG